MKEQEQSVWWWIPCLIGILTIQICLLFCFKGFSRWRSLKRIEISHRQAGQVRKQFQEALTYDPSLGLPGEDRDSPFSPSIVTGVGHRFWEL